MIDRLIDRSVDSEEALSQLDLWKKEQEIESGSGSVSASGFWLMFVYCSREGGAQI